MPAFNASLRRGSLAGHSSPGRLCTPLLAGLLGALAGACQPEKQRAAVSAAASLPAPLPAGAKILSKNRRFVYAVRWYAPAATTARLDTVVMTASGAPCAFEPTQTCVEWLFRADTVWASGFRGSVGAIENKEEFWLHPPRYGPYRILELNPFPHIKLPAVSGRTWEWRVYPPEMYADPAWASWKGILQVKFRYTLGGIRQLATPLGSLPCHRVQARGTSKLGTTALEAYFHPVYGFVRLTYRNIDASWVQLEMVAVDVRPESNEKALEQLLPKWSGVQQTN